MRGAHLGVVDGSEFEPGEEAKPEPVGETGEEQEVGESRGGVPRWKWR
ncbi:MAG: hypothetical protein JW797_02640 [Bradymonadales bacterium]|nr:hypothetical protein [Bradymonadales bacterium]